MCVWMWRSPEEHSKGRVKQSGKNVIKLFKLFLKTIWTVKLFWYISISDIGISLIKRRPVAADRRIVSLVSWHSFSFLVSVVTISDFLSTDIVVLIFFIRNASPLTWILLVVWFSVSCRCLVVILLRVFVGLFFPEPLPAHSDLN